MKNMAKNMAIRTLLVLCLVAAGMIVAIPARADDAEGFGPRLLKCFHPDAKFDSMTVARGRGHHAWTGWIKFQDHRTAAAMNFVMDTKNQDGGIVVRITPLTDSALSAPETSCYLREWQRAY